MKESKNRIMALLAVALVFLAPAIAAQEVSVDVSGNAKPGGMVTLTASIEGMVVESTAWTQIGGVPVLSMTTDTDSVVVRLGLVWQYRPYLIHVISEPPVGPEELPPSVPFPEGEFPGGLQDRFQVVGLNPFALEEAALVTFDVAVTTASGVYHGEAEIHTVLPWKPATGLRNVPIGVPVLLQGKAQAFYDWQLDPPAGSSATLDGAAGRNPTFTPDAQGIYDVMVTDLATMETVTLEVYAGSWVGVIVDQDADGRPIADPICTSCHNDAIAPDIFTPWSQTGHAEIFTNNINFNDHYSTNCFACHTVGYDPEVDNGGVDEADDYQEFLDADYFHLSGPDLWTTILEEQPDTARLANIQCENCHGPQITNAHALGEARGYPRASISSDVCATCHGEPLRHARFQQWQLSAHANYELAIDEAGSGNCSRCHTGNGFLSWLPILLDDDPATDPLDNITVDWTADDTHPQTCVVCHDPHNIGTISGNNTNANIYLQGDTPELIAGYRVFGAGRGAICMTCHNSRRGLRNDAVFDGLNDKERAPHGSAQTDMLMGENAYMVNVGVRGGHSLVEDTCVTCHMQATDPPDVLSYLNGGANHTFYASPDVCEACHGPAVTATVLQGAVSGQLAEIQGLIEQAYVDLIADLIAAGNTIDLNGDATIVDAADIEGIEFGETRGRQAIAVTLDGTTYGLYRLGDIDVVGAETVALDDVTPGMLLKAGWNWNLVNNDGSKGVHNPTYALTVLDAARDAVDPGGGGPRVTIETLFPAM